MKRSGSKKKNKWHDHYAQKAKKDKYPARSVYKLKEIQDKYHVLKKGNKVLDLGCSPGSWLLYTAEIVGKKGMVVGIDKKPVALNLPSNVRMYTGDIFILEATLRESLAINYHVVLSDMAPSTTGNKFVDAARSLDLCQAAFEMAQKYLMPGGFFVCKIFHGEDFQTFSKQVGKYFNTLKIFKPQSCRKASKEIYIIGKSKKQEALCQDTVNGQV